MKKCPVCGRTYTNQTMAFCLEDGTALNDFFSTSSPTQQYNPELPFIKQLPRDAPVSEPIDSQNSARPRVSFTARLITAICYIIPAIGGALSSISLINVFQALRSAENAGIEAVMGGVKEASIWALVSLYLAAFCGIGVIIMLVVRILVRTKTASPPGWFIFIAGILCLIPVGLFWRARSLVIEVLSPGSPVSAGGIGSVGAEISQWLILSVLAAPVVFILILIASVIPFSARSKPKLSPIIAAALIEILLLAAAFGLPSVNSEPKRKNETVKLPENIKYVDYDYDIDRETSMVLTLSADNKLSLKRQNDVSRKVENTENVITRADLPEKLKTFSESKPPDKQIVYLKADIGISYENVLQIFDVIRKAGIERVGLVVIGEKTDSDPYQTSAAMFAVKLPAPPENTNKPIRPNPLTLIAILESNGSVKLNFDDMGMISDPNPLKNSLENIFKDRDLRGVLREGTNEVEKTVFLKVSKSSKYGDFIKLLEAVKGAGAEPVGIQLDDLDL